MLRLVQNLVRRSSPTTPALSPSPPYLDFSVHLLLQNTCLQRYFSGGSKASASSPSLSIWRRKKEMGKEGLMVAKELKRLCSQPLRLDHFIRSHVSRLLKSDLLAVLAEFQRQDQVFLSIKVCFLYLFFFSLKFMSEFLLSLSLYYGSACWGFQKNVALFDFLENSGWKC